MEIETLKKSASEKINKIAIETSSDLIKKILKNGQGIKGLNL